MTYWKFLVRRFLQIIPVLFGLSVLIFVLARVVPGNPARIALGPRASEEAVAELRAEMRLDEPLWVQYFEFLQGLTRGELGRSLTTGRDVAADIGLFFPATLELAIVAMVVALALGIPLGVLSALNKDGLEDNVSRGIAFIGVSMPVFWAAILLQLFLAFQLGLFPATGRIGNVEYTRITGLLLLDSLITLNFEAFRSVLWHIWLPAVSLALAPLADITRMTRSSFIEEYNKEYIDGLRTHSIPEKLLIAKYVLRRSSTSTLTIAGLDFGFLIGGAFLVEIVFSYPGMARYGVQAILQNDFNAVVGVTLFIGLVYLLANFFVDVLYGLLDPRVRTRGETE
jgi:peptide/nickel transport system permease protein